MKNFYRAALVVMTAHSLMNAQQTFTNFQAASLVIGQSNFTTIDPSINEVNSVGASCADISSTGQFAVGSQGLGRVSIYNSLPSVNGASANVVLGKTSFTSTSGGCTQNLMSIVNGVQFTPDGKKLIVSDAGNNRVLIWNSIPTSAGQNADVVIGQSSFNSQAGGTAANMLSMPLGISVSPDGRLLICDHYNNRVLIFNKVPTSNNASADVVIGQSSFTGNNGGYGANELNGPWCTAITPSGKLLISDGLNNRVLVFNSIPTTNGHAADYVIGQPGFNSSMPGCAAAGMNNPVGVAVSSDGKLAVGEYGNNRVLIFNSVPASNGAGADVVLGQPTFTDNSAYNGGISAQSMAEPYSVEFDLNGRLFVTGRNMSRTMVFGTVPTQTAEIEVAMSVSSTSLCVGSSVTCSVVVTNHASAAADNVVAIAALPFGFGLTSASASNGTYANSYWNIPQLQGGASAMLMMTGTVGLNTAQTVPVYASIFSAQQADPNMQNNGTSALVNVSSGIAPAGGVLAGSGLVCSASISSYSVTGTANATLYYWSASNAAVTGTAATADVAFITPGTVTLSVLPSNGNCTGSPLSMTVMVSDCSGITRNTQASSIVFPVPATDDVTIESTFEMTKLEVFDVAGKTVMQRENLSGSRLTLNVQNLQPGLYILQSRGANGEKVNSRMTVRH